MPAASAEQQVTLMSVRVTREVFPPHHARHGTPHAVVERVFAFETPQGTVEVDQTDYGHPGRFNPCHLRRIPTPLQPRTSHYVAAAEALATLLD